MSGSSQIPDGRRIYAIGDIHGRVDLLGQLHNLIREDHAASDSCRPVAVYLGDYVDRGPHSFEVIDLLANEGLSGFETYFLEGNHENMMLGFLSGRVDNVWLNNGGIETLLSYNVISDWANVIDIDREELRTRLEFAVPESHLKFFNSLRAFHVEGGYFFAHAGIRPGVPLDRQVEHDLLWIRGPFLQSNLDYGKVVVHGHTITPSPEVRQNRIGIDTGAVFSGRLTCLVLEGSDYRFLHT